TLVAYGGAGPLHAAAYARHAGVTTVIVPPSATAYSAFGAAASDIQYTQMAAPATAFPQNIDTISDLFAQMEQRGKDALSRYGLDPSAMRFSRWADMRYERQFHDLRVRLSADFFSEGSDAAAEMISAFEERYRAAYGDAARITSSPVQVSRIGVDAVGEIEKPDLVKVPAGGASPDSAAERPARDIYWVER